MLKPGAVFAGYRIERPLGAGGMGAVYLVSDPHLPRHDALKVLSADLSRDPDFRARFVREADVAAKLDHPNIVSVYNRGETEDGQLWIAMQFVDGTDADAVLRDGTMTPLRAVHIVTEVAKALDHAHQRNVVHRDVKPANFLLSGPAGPQRTSAARRLRYRPGARRHRPDRHRSGDGDGRLRRPGSACGTTLRPPSRHLLVGLLTVPDAYRQNAVSPIRKASRR